MDDFTKAYNLVQQSVQQNNAWSAEQAQKQMDFQREMSNTAHQREIADLKAAGLNPVLSAKLGGASTPTGAAAQGDASGTSAIVDLLQMAMATAHSAAGAAYAAASKPELVGLPDANDGTAAASLTAGVGNLGSLERWFNGDKETFGSREWVKDEIGKMPFFIRWLGKPLLSVMDGAAQLGYNARMNGEVPPPGTSARKAYDKLHPKSSDESWKPASGKIFIPHVGTSAYNAYLHSMNVEENWKPSSNYAHASSNAKLSYRSSRKGHGVAHMAKQTQHKN